MPWRRTRDPYRIMVSEIMLQQTQVSRVLIKYPEFIKAFPTIESLAAAPRKNLLQSWSGLGHWRRVLFLQQAAKTIHQTYRGVFPRDPKTLEQLPGIGHYTARAMACFAFNNPEAFIDTNIRRVYLHFFFKKKRSVSDKEILSVANKAVWRQNPREWHYALFDYGATVLKDKGVNKRSRHYVKQSRFEGSFRSFRTAVMRFLLEQPNQKAPTGKIRRMLLKSGNPYPVEKVLRALEKDGLIKRQRTSYSL